MIDIDGRLEYHAAALRLRERRAQLIAENLANADTPNYKARDIDFRAAMQQVSGAPLGRAGTTTEPSLVRTHSNHLTTEIPVHTEHQYRTPSQPSLDGNTVEETVEKAKFGQNNLEYQASLRFLNSKIRGLMGAIRGE